MKAILIAALLGAMTLSTAGQEQRSCQDGVYSRAQAREGARLYRIGCAACHAPDAFAGSEYMDRWTGRSAAELFRVIQDGMPELAPGTLSRVETAALVAYLFRVNGMPAGDVAMESDAASLEGIRIEGPYSGE